LTTKIHLLADALGRPLRFGQTGGEAHESRTAEAMPEGVEGCELALKMGSSRWASGLTA
jgi:hypothetical protein